MNLSAQFTGSPEDVGPSRGMEIALHVLVFGLLGVSIIGVAFVYGFSLASWDRTLDDLSAAVRALGVDGGFFLGLYFSRRLWMRKKHGWWDGFKTNAFGLIWFIVALLMAALSWFSNTLFVASFQTVITSDLLTKSGFQDVDPKTVNQIIAAIPLVIVLLYSLVPRQSNVKVDERTPEEIEQEANREAARIRAQNKVAAAKAEGAGQRLRIVAGGLVGQAFDLDEKAKRNERRKQMRIALETAGYDTAGMTDEQVEIQAVSRGVWDQKKGEAIKSKQPARTTGATLRLPEGETEAETDEADDSEEDTDTTPSGSQVSWLDANAVAAFLEITKPTAVNWMKRDWTGPYRVAGCRNIKTKRGTIRKAPLASVGEVKKKLDAVRHSKNGATVALTREQLD